MRSRFMARLREEHGIAIVIVLLIVLVVSAMGATLVTVSIRDLDSSSSVQRSSTGLGIAEAAVQHAIQQLKKYGPTSGLLANEWADKSADTTSPGMGRWMDPSTAASRYLCPATAAGQLPLDNQYEGWMGTGKYNVYICAVDPINLPSKREGVYRVVATGVDKRDNPTRPGERTVEQNVRVKALDLPFALFAKDGVDAGGTPQIQNESLYTLGDIFWRENLSFTGTDMFYGGPECRPLSSLPPDQQTPCPAAAHANGVINRKGGQGAAANGPIHGPAVTDNCQFPYDRDKYGAAYPSPWPCAAAAPPYSTSKIPSDLSFNTAVPDEDTYSALKGLAQSTGTYFQHSANSTLVIDGNSGLPNNATSKFFVLYVDVTGNGDVAIKTGWGPQTNPPGDATCDASAGIIVVRNGDLSWENNQVWWGAAFVPEGEFAGAGSGQAWLVGTVYSKTINNTGNVRFQLNNCWIKSVPGPFFSVSRLRWHERDR